MNYLRSPVAFLTCASVAHATNDVYGNFLPQLLPFLGLAVGNFNLTKAVIVVASFNIAASLAQPVFGFLVDARERSWFVCVGTLWMACFLSLTGIVHRFPTLVVVSGLAGLGTAAFHPPASSLVNALSPRHKAFFQSVFVSSGYLGVALAPLLLVPLFQFAGPKATVFSGVPGLLAAALMLIARPSRIRASSTAAVKLTTVVRSIRAAGRELSLTFAIICLRSAAYTGLLALLPLYFHERRVPNLDWSRMLTLLLFIAAAGRVLGGYLSERVGRRPLVAWSLIITTPLLFGFLLMPGNLSFIFLLLGGAGLLANSSVTIVLAQDAIPAHNAIATGLSLGLASGIGATVIIFIGMADDLWGLPAALLILAGLPLMAGLTGFFLYKRPTSEETLQLP